MKGLRARAGRVLRGERLTIPMDLQQAMTMLVDAYEDWTEAQDTKDPAEPDLQARLLKICGAVGSIERRKKWAEYTQKWRERHGQAKGARGRGQKPLDCLVASDTVPILNRLPAPGGGQPQPERRSRWHRSR